MQLPTPSFRFQLYTWLVLIALAGNVFGQGNYFIYPPTVGTPIANGLVFELGSTVDLSWSTAYPAASLYLWQDTVAEYEILLNSVSTSTFGTQYTWTVATGLNLSASNMFHLCLYDLGPGAISLVNFNTVDFSISRSGSQLNATSPNPILSPSAQTTSVPIGRPTASSNSSPATTLPATTLPQETRLPQSTTIALGVALGFGLPLLFAAGILAGWHLRARVNRPKPLDAPPWIDTTVGQPPTAPSWGDPLTSHPFSAFSPGGSTLHQDLPQQSVMQEAYSPVEALHPCKLKQPSVSLYKGLSELEGGGAAVER
ncbi:hypothetical protein MMC34_004403 [Xylographa carneopallida]|nr:hypothetical protein [Xylographa carneopallida]